MKSQIKRFSKSTLSVILSCMLVSCMTVGLIAIDAAYDDSESVGYSGWKIKGNLDGWSSDLWTGTGNSGTAYIDCSSLVGSNFEFKLICEGTYCGTSKTEAISLNSEESLNWNSGNNIKYTVTKGVLKIKVNDTKITIQEDYARYKAYYNTSKTDTGGTGVELIPQSGSTNSRVGTASLSSNTKYYFYVKDEKETKYYRNETGTMNNTENEIQLYEYGTNNSNSIDMTTNISGTYTFTYDSSSKKIKTKYPDYTMNVENDGHGTPSISTTTVANYNGSATYSSGTADSGYIFDYWELTAGSVSPAITNSNKNNTSLTLSPTGNTSPIKVKAHYKVNLTPLPAPSTVTLNGSAANCTVDTTTVGAKIRLAWSSVTNAGSYKIYKGDTEVTSVTGQLYYDIERANSYSGAYSVVAVPSNTNLYSESPKSTARTLTVNKSRLNTPTVAVDKTDIASGQSVQLTVTDTNTSFTAAQFDYYYYTGNAVTISDTYKITPGTPKSLEPTSDTVYKVCVYPKNGGSNDYYLQSFTAEASEVKVYSAPLKIAGDLPGTSWNYSNGVEFTNYVSNGVFYYRSPSKSAGNQYFSLYDSSGNQYSGDNNNSDCVITLGEENKYDLTINTHSKSFKVYGSGIFFVYYDTVNNQIWVEQNTWAITPHVYYQSYNLVTDSYNSVQDGTTGGTISPSNETLVTKGSSVTLTATAASGYTFDGWYNNSDFASGHKVSSNASYTFTPSASGDYYALFKQTVTRKTITLSFAASGANVSVTYNGTTKGLR